MRSQVFNMADKARMEKIGNLAEFKRGPFGSAVKKSMCVPKGLNTYKLYEQGNVINNDFKRGKYYLTKEKFESLSQFQIRTGDLLLTCAGTLGKIAIVPEKIEPGVFNSVLMRIRPDYNKITRKYIYYYFKSAKIQNDINRQSAGVAIKNLFATKELKEYTIYYPDKHEQGQIVDEIEKQFTRLDKLEETVESSLQKTEKLRKSILKSAFEGEAKLLEKIGNLAEFKRGPFGSDIKKSVCVSKGANTFKLYEQGNVIKDNFERGTYYLTEERFKSLSQFEIRQGDLLLTCAGTLGRMAIVPEKIEKGIFNSALMRIRPNYEKMTRKYIYYYFKSPKIQNDINRQSAGVAIKNLFATKKLKEYTIYYPEKKEQELIVKEIESYFSVIDKFEETVESSLQKTEKLRKSILKSAFEGKLIEEAA